MDKKVEYETCETEEPVKPVVDITKMKFPERDFAVYDTHYMGVIRDHFTKKSSGGAGGFVTSGKSADTWKNILQEKSYYPYWEDNDLILKHGGFYAELAREGNEGKPLTLVELGSGPASTKTRNILNSIRPDNYVVVEESWESILETMVMVKEDYPDINAYMRKADFNRAHFERTVVLTENFNQSAHGLKPEVVEQLIRKTILPMTGRRIIVQFGATLGNMPGFFHGPLPQVEVNQALRNYRLHARAGDLMILGIDQNSDEKSVNACYGGYIHEEMAMEKLQTISEDLPVKGFDPTNFAYVRPWNNKTQLKALGWTAVRDNEFTIDGQKAQWKSGEFLSLINTWKYRQDWMDDRYAQSGWEKITVHRSPDNRMSHQVLRAI